ncbi:lipid-A-disaccharide kinase [Tistlia consotensis]|uniref:Tetraacyldisaccharide 4'-kinase n=1 Tax=Tistlia consotensis USBA 355 TaxID=560819 RepID=A0A1Y6CNJ0_9PROT|nr:tetraacyldisaccharide 4'-kinase [Tistlia consotensis]SMF62354.1 lipid-A-disaccharide kinase [Tistlia consotensis USBA 355]SNR94611.1 lipid-A-disaccharide kinase [Tistlia consotensis]
MRAPDFWSGRGALSSLLLPLALGYDLAGWLRWRVVNPVRLPVPVICVGNLTAGGAGKTPTVLALVELLAERALAVHAVTRGYGGRERGPLRVDPALHDAAAVGDEPLLLARACPTWVARERAAGARAAAAAGAEVLLLDDGLQNPGLAKDLALAVVDGAAGLGNGRVLPAGPLRENLTRGLGRADALLSVGGDWAPPPAAAGKPLLRAELVAETAGAWRGRRVLAFAGIGRPAKFFDTLAGLGAELAGTRAFADHHPYTAADGQALLAEAGRLGAELATTEKDFVRLPPPLAAVTRVLPVHLRWRDKRKIDALLERALADGHPQP